MSPVKKCNVLVVAGYFITKLYTIILVGRLHYCCTFL